MGASVTMQRSVVKPMIAVIGHSREESGSFMVSMCCTACYAIMTRGPLTSDSAGMSTFLFLIVKIFEGFEGTFEMKRSASRRRHFIPCFPMLTGVGDRPTAVQ